MQNILREALQSRLSMIWQEAVNSEFQSLPENNAWELEEFPSGIVESYKAWLVEKGYTQKSGKNYDKTCGLVLIYTC